MDAILENVDRGETPHVGHPNPVGYGSLLSSGMIELRNVSKDLGQRKVLDGVSIAVQKGETMCIIGGSGAGKSVTLKHVVGLLKPDQGSVFVDGLDVTRSNHGTLERVRRKIGFLFQGAALLNSMSVFENVALPLREHEKYGEEEIRERVMQKLALVGLEKDGHKMPSQISGGMQKRVGLARAIVRNPEIILYDEPTAGLDPVVASQINNLVLDMQAKLGVTSLLVTHDMESVRRVANRIAMLLNGKIHKLGTTKDFWESDDPVIRQFIRGEPEGPLTKEMT